MDGRNLAPPYTIALIMLMTAHWGHVAFIHHTPTFFYEVALAFMCCGWARHVRLVLPGRSCWSNCLRLVIMTKEYHQRSGFPSRQQSCLYRSDFIRGRKEVSRGPTTATEAKALVPHQEGQESAEHKCPKTNRNLSP